MGVCGSFTYTIYLLNGDPWPAMITYDDTILGFTIDTTLIAVTEDYEV